MESNNQQLEELKKKIENYRHALERLQTSKAKGNSQTEKRVENLEEQFLKLETNYSELSDRIKMSFQLIDRLREVLEEEITTVDSKQWVKVEERQNIHSESSTIPSFNVLKQLAKDNSAVNTNSQSLYQDEPSFTRARYKKNQFKALPVTDSLQISHTFSPNNSDQPNEAVTNSNSEIEILSNNSDSISTEPINEPENKSHHVEKQATGFWRGILKK